MAKSRDAFRTISEVADWLDTPAHVLRFWESKFTQIKPVKRAGGRRYYRPQDMALLGGIKNLLHDQGMTIKGAQKLLREEGVKHVASLGPDPDGSGNTMIDVTPKAAAKPKPAKKPVEKSAEEHAEEPALETVHDVVAEPDPNDPWPADPAPSEPAADAVTATVARDAAAQNAVPKKPAPDASEPDDNAASAPPATPARSIPVLPDEAAAQERPGIVAVALAASPSKARKNRAAILPLLARLQAARDSASAA